MRLQFRGDGYLLPSARKTTGGHSGHRRVEHLLDRSSSIWHSILSLVGVVVSEPFQPAASTRLAAPPNRTEAADPRRDGLKPLFEVVSVAVVELTARLTTREDSRIASGIDDKLGVRDVVFLGKSMQERRPQNAERSDGLHESGDLVNAAGSFPAAEHADLRQHFWRRADSGVQPLLFPVDLDLLLSTGTRDSAAVGESRCAAESVYVQFRASSQR